MSDSFMIKPELNGESFLLQGDQTAILMVHGFTATTTEVRTLADHFHKLGHTVAAPLLPGHGTHPDELNQTTWQDWYTTAEHAYRELSKNHKAVWVAGESMGALLCLKLAMDYPEIGGLMLFSPALKVHNLSGAYFLQFFRDYLDKSSKESSMPWKGYNVYPLKGAVQLRELQKEVTPSLGKIHQPTLVMVSQADETVKLETGQEILDAIASPVKELLVLEHSPHVMLLGPESELIFRKAEQFFDQNSQSGAIDQV